MKLDKQISKDGDNKDEERKEPKMEKETKEEVNERLAGTSSACPELPDKANQEQYSKISFDDGTEKTDEGQGEKALKEQLEMSRMDSKLALVNLETIREGEVLEIPPDTASPPAHGTTPWAKFYFEDNTVSTHNYSPRTRLSYSSPISSLTTHNPVHTVPTLGHEKPTIRGIRGFGCEMNDGKESHLVGKRPKDDSAQRGRGRLVIVGQSRHSGNESIETLT